MKKAIGMKVGKKSRFEEVFILCLTFTVCMMGFIATGCGQKKSCETIKVTSESDVVGVSLPGLGGCLTSGEGCGDCSLWSQSCKFVAGRSATAMGGNREKKEVSFVGAANIFYEDKGVMGCTSYEATSCWTAAAQSDDWWIVAGEHPTCGSCSISSAGCGGGREQVVRETFNDILMGLNLY